MKVPVALAFALSLATGLSAQTPEPLERFHASLAESTTRPVRVVVYGASHTASDEFTSELRARLQHRFGDGGLGWVLPASPFPYYAHADVDIQAHGFEGRFVRYRDRVRDDYGLPGFAVEATGAAQARLTLRRDVTGQSLAVSYLQQPGGGAFDVAVAGETYHVRTDGPRETRLITLLETLPRTRTVSLVTTGDGPVRLFGLAFEHDAGVTVDAFGVPGTSARDQRIWNDRSLDQALASRPPDLVVLAYGTNESARRAFSDDREELRRVVHRLRTLTRASCLLVGPGEWPRRRGERWLPRPRTRAVIEDQRAVAAAEGCAHFDTYHWMGGDGAMERWVREGLALSDRVHFTAAGHARLAEALARLLR